MKVLRKAPLYDSNLEILEQDVCIQTNQHHPDHKAMDSTIESAIADRKILRWAGDTDCRIG